MEIINLDMTPSTVTPNAHAGQYDASRIVRFMLKNGGVPFTLAGTETITAEITRSDNTEVTVNVANTSSNYVDVVFDDTVCTVKGLYACELRLKDSDGFDIGSKNFALLVQRDPYDGAGIHVVTVGPSDICTFETTLAEPLQSVTADIVATQSGSGTPYPAGGGKNKFDGEYPSLDTTLHYRGIYVGNGTFTMSSNCPIVEGAALVFFLEGNVSTGASTSINGVSNNISRTVTTTDGYVTIAYRTYGTPTISPANYNVQIEAGSEATPFVPYSNVRPINGYSSANITQCGVNLFDKDSGNIINAYISTKIEALAACRTVFAKCKPSTTYTVIKNSGQCFIVAYTKEVPDINVNVYGNIQDATATHISITTGADAKYIVAMVYNGNVDTVTADEMLASVQIAEGTDTTYHAYNGQTYAVAFGQTVYGGVLDVTRGKLTVENVKLTLNGTEAWGNYPAYNCVSLVINNMKSGNFINGICSHFATLLSHGHGIRFGANNNLIYCEEVYTDISGVTDVDSWKTWLSNNNIDIVYPLDTPFDIDLTPEVISAVVGTNNVFADCGETTVKYLKAGE